MVGRIDSAVWGVAGRVYCSPSLALLQSENPTGAACPPCPAPPLPALAESSRTQLFFSGLSIAAAFLLLGAVGVRVLHGVTLVQWWVPVALLAGIVAADFGSGLLHWAADTWGRADLPLIGPRILVPFRVHHVNPDDFLRRSFLDTNGDVAAITVPVLLGLLFLPIDTTSQHRAALFGFGLCGMGMMTNQIHQWAHMPSPPQAVRLFQQFGLLLRADAHALHHDGSYDARYCIPTGWCNRPLEAVAFFRRLEAGISRLTGAIPRDDERRSAAEYGAAGAAVTHDA
jgi:plasmanylethanolamine desaturase